MVRLLVEVGAHLSLSPAQLGARLSAAGRAGDLAQLRCWAEAGAALGLPDPSTGLACADTAAAAGHGDILQRLRTGN